MTAAKEKPSVPINRRGARDFPSHWTVTRVGPNPKRAGSSAHARFALWKEGASVADMLNAGLQRSDILWDTERGFVTIEAPESERSITTAPPTTASAAPGTPPANRAGGASRVPERVDDPWAGKRVAVKDKHANPGDPPVTGTAVRSRPPAAAGAMTAVEVRFEHGLETVAEDQLILVENNDDR